MSDVVVIAIIAAIPGVITAISSLYNGQKLGVVHTLVNSNFTEAKAARLAAEAALKTQQDLNMELRQQLSTRIIAPVDVRIVKEEESK